MTIRDWTATELLSTAFFVLTAVLLLYASSAAPVLTRRLAAIAAIMSIAVADYFLLASYRGESALAFDRPGPTKRSGSAGRGYFQFDDEGDGSGSVGDAGGASAGSGGNGIVLASWSSAADEKVLRALDRRFNDCPGCPEMIVIRPGYFRMGATPDDAAATDAERPARMIGFGSPYAIGRTEVTIAQYASFVTATGHAAPACPEAAHDKESTLPVTCVSWRDADAYARWLAHRTGKPFRLPSEAEWEYAARAGAPGLYATGERLPRASANIGRPDGLTVPVGSYPPNAFGVADMHGNAAELVADCWTGSPSSLPGNGRPYVSASCTSRVVRDAHAGELAMMTRLSARRPIAPDIGRPGVGFRLARDLK